MRFSCSWRGCCQQEEKAREEGFKDHKIGGGSPAEGSRMTCRHKLPGRAGSLCRHWLALCSTLVCNIWTGTWSKQSFLFYRSQNTNRVCQQVFAVNWMAQHQLEAGRKGWRTALWWKRQLFRNDCKLIEKANSTIIASIIIVINNFHQYWCIFLNLIWVRCKNLLPSSCQLCLKRANCFPVYLVKLQIQTGTTVAANHTSCNSPEAWMHGGGQTS